SNLSPQQVEVQDAVEPELLRERKSVQNNLSTEKTSNTPFAGRRILVVDDDLQNLLALTPQLETWGFEVAAAGDGQEAIDTLSEDPEFSLVLMDIMMPELDGYDTIRYIRKTTQLKALKVIVLSAKNAAEDRKRSLDAGADDFVAKPVDSDKLQAVIKEHLGPE
ncbi:MAG: response regulator, partial [Candidatus Thiodiazotropha sp. (ex Lucinoma borealis)]|nr:response regulator [Candidatus Thiodiazotropha sp. (ex Lucinoma borealis)]